MTTAYTSLLGLALPVQGELSGTWGDTVNNSITSLLDTSVAGTTNVSTDTDVTLTTTTGAANTARQAILLFSGARTALRTVTAPAQSKVYTVINATTGGFSVKLVGSGPTTGLTIPNGASAVVAWNGSDFVEVGAGSIGNLTVNGTLTVTGATTLQSNLTFSSTGQRIIADMSNATITNRLAFQTSTTNSSTVVGAIPNGTSNVASFLVYNNSDPTNSSNGGVLSTSTEMRLQSGISGTGTYLPLTIYTNGAERGRFDTAGNLGIGTSSPAYKLQVAGTVGVSGIITSTVTGGQVLAAGSGNTAGIYSNFANTGGTLQYGIDNSTGSYIYGNSSNYAGFIGTTGATSLVLATNSVVRMTINSSGNVGIANANPTYKLDLYNVSGSSSGARIYGNDQSNVRLRLENAGSGGVPWDLVSGLNGASNAFFSIYNATLGATALSIDATSNNVGIGATPNTAKLYVYQGTAGNIGFTASHVNGNSIQVAASYNYYDAYNHIFRSLSGTTTYATIDNSGNLGLGVTPSAWRTGLADRALDVGETTGLYYQTGGTTVLFNNAYRGAGNTIRYKITGAAQGYWQDSGQHYWTTAASGTAGNAITFTQAMTLDTSGNLGVGETSPTSRLHVSFTSNSVDNVLQIQQKGNNTASGLSLAANDNNGAGYNFIRSLTTGGTTHWQISGGVATSTMAFSTGGTERARINSLGNFIIGATTSGAGARLEVNGVSSAGEVASFTGTSALGTLQVFNQPGVTNRRWGIPAGQDAFIWTGFNSGAYLEQMRLDNTGNLLVGTTSVISAGKYSSSFNGSVSNGIILQTTLASSGSTFIGFINSAGSTIGSINQNATSTVIYNTSSDYRLKNITGALTGYKERLMSLQPKQGTWIADGSEFRGFLAHEFAQPYRASVTGEKDAVDEAGNPIYQGMQASSSEVMADLVAMVNELITENASLKARLDAANL